MAAPAYTAFRSLESTGLANVSRLPFSIRFYLKSLLRNCDGYEVTEQDVGNLAGLECRGPGRSGSPFQARPRRAARFHRRAVRGRSGRHARR